MQSQVNYEYGETIKTVGKQLVEIEKGQLSNDIAHFGY